MNAMSTMFDELTAMQLPIITVTNLSHKNIHNEYTLHHLIIVPDGTDRVVTFTFEKCVGNDNISLIRTHSESMSFTTAIKEYSNHALQFPGAIFSLYSI